MSAFGGFGDVLRAILNRAGQQAQATQQGTLGLGPDPNAGRVLHYGAAVPGQDIPVLGGVLGVGARVPVTALQLAGLVGEAGGEVGKMATGTTGAALGALQAALNSPYGGAVTALAHTVPVVGSVADALNMAPHLGPLNFMEAGPLKSVDAQRALAAFLASPGPQGELAANEALAQGNQVATGAANMALNPLNWVGGLGELGAGMRATRVGVDALGGLAPTAEPAAIRALGAALQGASKVGEFGNAPAAALFSGAWRGIRGGPMAGLAAAANELGAGRLRGVGEAIANPTGPLEGLLADTPAFAPAGPTTPTGLPPSVVRPAPQVSVPRMVRPAPQAFVSRPVRPAPQTGADLVALLRDAIAGPLRPGQETIPPAALPQGPLLPPTFGPPLPGRRVVPPTTLPDVSYRPGNVPRGAGPLGPPLPPELLPAESILGNVPVGQGPLGPALPPALQPPASIPGNVPRGRLGPPPPPVYGPPRPGRVNVPPTVLPEAREALVEALSGATPPAALSPAAAGDTTPWEDFVSSTAATYRSPALPPVSEALSASQGIPAALAAAEAADVAPAAMDWADRTGVIRQAANAPLTHLTSILADLHNALYPGQRADFAIPALTGQPKAAFRTSFLLDQPGQNRAEPYLDYLLNRVQHDSKAAARLVDINPTLADDVAQLAQSDLAPAEHKALIQSLFKGVGETAPTVAPAAEAAAAGAIPGTVDDFNALLTGPWSRSMYVPDAAAFAKRLNVPEAQAQAWIDDATRAGTLTRSPQGDLTFAPKGAARATVPDLAATPEAVPTPEPTPAAAAAAAEALPEQSTGHVAFIGNFEYFTGPNGDLYRAPLYNEVMTDGFRGGARFEGTGSNAARRIQLAQAAEANAIPTTTAGQAGLPGLGTRTPGGDIAAGGGGGGLGIAGLPGGLTGLPSRLITSPAVLGGLAGGTIGGGVGLARGDRGEDFWRDVGLGGAGGAALVGGVGSPSLRAVAGLGVRAQGRAFNEGAVLPKGEDIVGYVRALKKTFVGAVGRNTLGAAGNIAAGHGSFAGAGETLSALWNALPEMIPKLEAVPITKASNPVARAAAEDARNRIVAQYLPDAGRGYDEDYLVMRLKAGGAGFDRSLADLGAANVNPLSSAGLGGLLAHLDPVKATVMGPFAGAAGLAEGFTLPGRVAMQQAVLTPFDIAARDGAFAAPLGNRILAQEAPGFIAKATAIDPSLSPVLDTAGKFGALDILGGDLKNPDAALQALAGEWRAIQQRAADAAGVATKDAMGNFSDSTKVGTWLGALFPGGSWNVQQAAVVARAMALHPALALTGIAQLREDYQRHLEEGDPEKTGTWRITDQTPGFGLIARAATGGGRGQYDVNLAYPFSPVGGEILDLPRQLDPRFSPGTFATDKALKVAGALGLAMNPEIQALLYKEGAVQTPPSSPLRLEPAGHALDTLIAPDKRYANPVSRLFAQAGQADPVGDAQTALRMGRYLDPGVAQAGAELIFEQTNRPASDPRNAPYLAELRDPGSPLHQEAVDRSAKGQLAQALLSETAPAPGQAATETQADVRRAQTQLFQQGIPFTKAQVQALASGDRVTASMALQEAMDSARLGNSLLRVNDAATPEAQSQSLLDDWKRRFSGLQLFPAVYQQALAQQGERLGTVPAGTAAATQALYDALLAGQRPGPVPVWPGGPPPQFDPSPIYQLQDYFNRGGR